MKLLWIDAGRHSSDQDEWYVKFKVMFDLPDELFAFIDLATRDSPQNLHLLQKAVWCKSTIFIVSNLRASNNALNKDDPPADVAFRHLSKLYYENLLKMILTEKG